MRRKTSLAGLAATNCRAGPFALIAAAALSIQAEAGTPHPRVWQGTLTELAQTGRYGPSLGGVNLQGCWSELAAPDHAGYAGIQAPLQVGARSVLASLWAVVDDSTAQLMQRFYAQRARAQPTSRAQALRQAQLSLLEGTATTATNTAPATGPNANQYYRVPLRVIVESISNSITANVQVVWGNEAACTQSHFG